MWSTSGILVQMSLVLLRSQFAAFVKNFWSIVGTAGSTGRLDCIMSNSTILAVSSKTESLVERGLHNNVSLLVISRLKSLRSS